MPPDQVSAPDVLHRATLLASGFTDDEIRKHRRSGLWQSLHRGTYCAATSLASLADHEKYRLRVLAIAARSPHLVVSHQSAALLLGLPVKHQDLQTVHLIRRGTGGRTQREWAHGSRRQLEPDETVLVDGMLVTSVARTLVDLGCTASRDAAVMAADHALRQRLVTPGGTVRGDGSYQSPARRCCRPTGTAASPTAGPRAPASQPPG